MAKLLKVAQNLFASSHGNDEVAQFGSLAASAINYTDDPTLIQSLTQFLEGLFSVTASAAQPPRIEDLNALFLLIFRQLKYGFQSGIPEYDPLENYYNESGHISIIQEAGKIYVSQSGTDVSPNVGNNPSTDIGVNWKALTIDTIGPHAITDCNTAWPSLNIVAGTVLFFITSANPANGPGTSTYFGTWTYNSSTSQIQTAIGLDGKKWFRIMTAGTWGTWTSEITSATLGSGWAATLASALGSNWASALGENLGAGWGTDLAQDVSFQNVGFSGTAGNWMTLFQSTDLANAFGGCLLELGLSNSPTYATGVFALNFPGGLNLPIVSQLAGYTLNGPTSVAISWDGTRYYISVYVTATQASSGISARLIPLTMTASYYWQKVVTQSASLPGTTGNAQQAITTTGTAPAPMTGQTHQYSASTNITLDACNLYETRLASGLFNTSSTTGGLFLPSTGTYQWIALLNSTALGNSGEAAGGSVVLGPFSSQVAFVALYRRIA